VKGDFSRDSFDRFRHFSRVLLQQGRVALDADANEESSIILHFLRQLVADLIGEDGGPVGNCGFEIGRSKPGADLAFGAGRYYVDGILCENDRAATTYRHQPDFPVAGDEELPGGLFLAYLDVWERHITWLEDDRIREVALGGPDTATRAKVVWQVKLFASDGLASTDREGFRPTWEALKRIWQPSHRGHLKARLGGDSSRFTGLENQLYRVEIHGGSRSGSPTFKWSRENGSVAFPIRHLEISTAILGSAPAEGRRALHPGDWIELVNDAVVLRGEPGLLFRIAAVHPDGSTVELELRPGVDPPPIEENDPNHPMLRRWDHQARVGTASAADGGIELEEDVLFELENGIQVVFDSASQGGSAPTYRSGDYWLIPARPTTGDIEWPRDDRGNALPEPPCGVEHHYAPLALIDAGCGDILDLRRKFRPLASS
jgi:hypothetical protein